MMAEGECDDDNDEEEDMISLGLSPNSANEDDSSSSVVGDCGRKHQTASIALVGTSDCSRGVQVTQRVIGICPPKLTHT